MLVVPVFYLGGQGPVLAYLVAAVLLFFGNRFFYEREFPGAVSWAGARLVGIVYITVPLSHVIALREIEGGRWWILFVLVVIWTTDIFAFSVGSIIGRHKLCPSISPNKTVEGVIGGLAGGVIAGILLNGYLSLGAGNLEIIYFSLFLGALGVVGDLVESVMKRGAGVKDSGHIIPGHGGMLDRIDSILFAIPGAYYYLT